MSSLPKKEGTEEIILRIQDVYKNYGKKVVHAGINLTVKRGEVLTLMGGSGSGKSVLLRSLIGLDHPDRGHIFFHDQEITKMDEEALVPVRKRIAYVFQYGALFDSYTVKENLAYPLREHTQLSEDEIHEKVLKTLKRVGLEGSENLFPGDLSGGMQRRVGVARSVIMDPEVILYDEPTTGLDPYNGNQILKILQEIQKQGTTSVLVTHDMHAIFKVTDRVAFLKDGRIRSLGTADEIRNSSDPVVKSFIEGESW